ncbi:phage portal protein [Clostridium magnum]|uniref:phage portal protein n=1 Tax=Clostridium magnum TaxID=33954 RepID=UPI000913DA70|nr:phage portal protein [Clostridium magnum]SHJ13812.1 phage portal protein, HK97 family [Clostridium magnum DSM 2767]
MGMFSRLFELKGTSNNQDNIYPTIARVKASSPKYTDVKYTSIAKDGYMGNYIIYRCLQEIIRSCVSLDWKVMKYNSKGEEEEIKNHPVQQLIEKPNPLYGQAELIKRAVAFYYIGGECPFVKITAGGKALRLNAYRPDKIKFKSTGDVDQPYQNIIYNASMEQPINPENFMLWKNLNVNDEWDGLGHGASPLQPVLKNGDLLNSLLSWNMSLLENGTNLSGVIATDTNTSLSDKQFDRAKAQIQNRYGGKEKVGKIMLLEGGMKFFPTSTTPKDMDWTQGKMSVMTDIIIGMGLDPIVVGINENSSYNNKKEAMKSLYNNLAIPLMLELADSLGPFLGLKEGEYLTIDSSKVPALQEDLKELNESINNAKDLTINEKRAKRGVEPIEGGDIIAPEGSYAIVDGKVYLPMNLISIEDETSKQPLNNSQTQEENKSLENFLY